jgi:hypothetical protein
MVHGKYQLGFPSTCLSAFVRDQGFTEALQIVNPARFLQAEASTACLFEEEIQMLCNKPPKCCDTPTSEHIWSCFACCLQSSQQTNRRLPTNNSAFRVSCFTPHVRTRVVGSKTHAPSPGISYSVNHNNPKNTYFQQTKIDCEIPTS